MDIWEWVRQTERDLRDDGQGRLAFLIDNMPTYACDDAHDQLDAAYPEALALARDLKLDHVELFLRHWNLQSRILHRMEAREYLSEAVSLLEYAHRPENTSCPQSVCVTQDLAIAYKQRDRIGYAPERLAVSGETLERIDASWSCFECIGLEQVSAMVDSGDAEGALARLDVLCGLIEKTTQGPYLAYRLHRMDAQRVIALEHAGRLEEATELALERVAFKERSPHEDRHSTHSARLEAARMLALSGRGEESVEMLPDVDALFETPAHYQDLSDTLVALQKLGEVDNDWRLGSQLGSMASKLHDQGVSRSATEIAWEHARLAIERGASATARRALELVEASLAELRAPHDLIAGALPDATRRAAELESSVEVPETDEALRELVGGDPERDLELFEAVLRVRPDSDDAFHGLANVYGALGMRAELLAHLRRGFAAAPDDARLMRLASTLADVEGPASVRAFVEGQIDGELAVVARFARATFGGMSAPDRIADLEVAIAAEPQLSTARLALATAHRELGDHASSLAALDDQLAAFGPDQRDVHWDRMTAATALGQWDQVRASAEAIGFPVTDGTGPIDEEYGFCRLRLGDEDDQPEVWAMRSGPTSARLVSLSRVGEPQRFNDLYAFDAQPLNPPEQPLEEGESHPFVYPAVALVQRGTFGPTYSLDGPRPTPDQLTALTEHLEGMGALVSVRSPDEYVVYEEGSEEPIPAVYIVFAFEGAAALEDVDAALTEKAGEWALPMSWYALARTVHGEEGAARHLAVCERFRMSVD